MFFFQQALFLVFGKRGLIDPLLGGGAVDFEPGTAHVFNGAETLFFIRYRFGP
jgi:hypothetical protein